MKRLTQIFQALLGVVALILTAIVAAGRLAWRKIRNWWKKRSKWVRRVIATLLIVFAAGFVALVAYTHYDSKYGRKYWRDETVSDNVEVRYFNDGKCRVYNSTTEEYTTDKICWLAGASNDLADTLAVYALPHRRGYIDTQTGEIVIDAEANNYQKAWIFSEGLAAVVQDGKIGFINAQNEVVIPFMFDYSDNCRLSRWGFGYVFHNGYCTMTNAEGRLGLIDKNGNWVVEPVYDEIWAPHKNGYRVMIKENRYGILDPAGTVIYPAKYDYVEVVFDGFVLTQEGRQWQEDFCGNVVHPFLYDHTYYLNYPVGYNELGEIQYAFADYVKYEVMSRYGIMNRITGKPITPAIYSDINMLSEELFEVQDPANSNYYLLTPTGNVIPNR